MFVSVRVALAFLSTVTGVLLKPVPEIADVPFSVTSLVYVWSLLYATVPSATVSAVPRLACILSVPFPVLVSVVPPLAVIAAACVRLMPEGMLIPPSPLPTISFCPDVEVAESASAPPLARVIVLSIVPSEPQSLPMLLASDAAYSVPPLIVVAPKRLRPVSVRLPVPFFSNVAPTMLSPVRV